MSLLNSLIGRAGKEAMRHELTSGLFSYDKDIKNDNDRNCYCKKENRGKMILCEKCCGWFHYDCAGITEGKEPNEFFCKICIIKNKGKNKRKVKVKSQINKKLK